MDRADYPGPEPTEPGWYGTVSSDGEGEVWVGVAYWTGLVWSSTSSMKRVYARSASSFATKELAWDWASTQKD